MGNNYWPKVAIKAFKDVYQHEDRFLHEKDNTRRVEYLDNLWASEEILKDVINKADVAFEKAYADGDYQLGGMDFQYSHNHKVTFTVIGNDQDAKAKLWWPPYSAEFAVERIWVRFLPDKNESNSVVFWFSEGKKGRIQPFRNKEDVKEQFWLNFFISLLNAADKHNQRQEEITTANFNRYEKSLNTAINSVEKLIRSLQAITECREDFTVNHLYYDLMPLEWMIKGYELDKNATRFHAKDELERMRGQYSDPEYWPDAKSVIEGLAQLLLKTQQMFEAQKQQRKNSKKTHGFIRALTSEYNCNGELNLLDWARRPTNSPRCLPALFIENLVVAK